MKICSRCHSSLPLNQFYKHRTCKDGLQYVCKSCSISYARLWQKNHRDRFLAGLKTHKLKRRYDILNHYGNKCTCCGEDNRSFLTIDHINNDGAKQRRLLQISSGSAFYRWIIKNNFPSNLQILCYNCNCAKQYSGLGFCPHKLEKKTSLPIELYRQVNKGLHARGLTT